jgi:hypothetical protein
MNASYLMGLLFFINGLGRFAASVYEFVNIAVIENVALAQLHAP